MSLNFKGNNLRKLKYLLKYFFIKINFKYYNIY